MILIKLHPTGINNIALARNIRIRGEIYHIDIYSQEYLNEDPNKIQNIEVHNFREVFGTEFDDLPIIEIE